MVVLGKQYTDKEQAGKAILLACKQTKAREALNIGSYKGFDMAVSYDSFSSQFFLELKREMTYTVTLGSSDIGNIARIDNALTSISNCLENSKMQLETLNEQLATALAELGKPFPQEKELSEILARLSVLNTELNMDMSETPSEESRDGKDEVADAVLRKTNLFVSEKKYTSLSDIKAIDKKLQIVEAPAVQEKNKPSIGEAL